MFNLKPKEDKFYTMMSESAKNVSEAAKVLRKNLDCPNIQDSDMSKTEKLENKADELVRVIIKELNDAFITPMDREDIYEVVRCMDKILDLINSTMHRFRMFNVEKSTEALKKIADVLVNITSELEHLIGELKNRSSRSNTISERLAKISKIEHDGDILFRQTVGDLFKNETNPLEVIKWKEIYQNMENTIDLCERVSNVVEGVVIKNA